MMAANQRRFQYLAKRLGQLFKRREEDSHVDSSLAHSSGCCWEVLSGYRGVLATDIPCAAPAVRKGDTCCVELSKLKASRPSIGVARERGVSFCGVSAVSLEVPRRRFS